MKAPLRQVERVASGTHYALELLRLPLDIAKGCQGMSSIIQYEQVRTCTYWYILVCTGMYNLVHTSMYWYVQPRSHSVAGNQPEHESGGYT